MFFIKHNRKQRAITTANPDLLGGYGLLYLCVCVGFSWLYQWGCSTVICLSLIDSWQAVLGIGNSSVTLSLPSLSLLLPFGYQLFVGPCVVLQKLDPVLPQQFSSQKLLLWIGQEKKNEGVTEYSMCGGRKEDDKRFLKNKTKTKKTQHWSFVKMSKTVHFTRQGPFVAV